MTVSSITTLQDSTVKCRLLNTVTETGGAMGLTDPGDP